jgi:chromosome segregation ATPase
MQTTWSAKIEETQKEKLQQLIEQSGLNVKDFLGDMILNYELNNAKVHVKDVAQDITELQQLTTRINNIFINVAERIESIKANAEIDKATSILNKENIINTLTEKLNALKQELVEVKTEKDIALTQFKEIEAKFNDSKDAYDKELAQLHENNINNQALINEYKDKIENLSVAVNNYKEKALNYDILSSEAIILQNENSSLKEVVSKNERIAEELESVTLQVTEVTKDKAELIAKIKDIEIENERNLLKVQKEYNDSLEKIRLEYGEKLLQLVNKK